MTKNKIGFIGAGNMGSALIKAILENSKHEVLACDQSKEKSKTFNQSERVTFTSLEEVVENSTQIFICVKPKDFSSLASNIRALLTSKQTVISIMAGVSIAKIKKSLNATKTIRVMPNTPTLIGKGAGAICFDTVSTTEKKNFLGLFNKIGYFVEVNESDMHAVTALSGSGPAYIFMILEAMTDAGVKLGLSREVASQLTNHTVFGSAQLTIQSGKHPMLLKDQVTSPNGTTIAALSVLEQERLPHAIISAITSAYNKSIDLSSN